MPWLHRATAAAASSQPHLCPVHVYVPRPLRTHPDDKHHGRTQMRRLNETMAREMSSQCNPSFSRNEWAPLQRVGMYCGALATVSALAIHPRWTPIGALKTCAVAGKTCFNETKHDLI